jgi:T3SS (YopN, CesT) and YbjN peptide-binding chaperone 1
MYRPIPPAKRKDFLGRTPLMNRDVRQGRADAAAAYLGGRRQAKGVSVNVSVFVRSYVERCLADMLGVCRVPADQDGDYFFRSGSAACYVRVEDQDPVIVRVFAIAATGVSRSAKLLAEINEVNSRSRSAWATWAAGQVVVSQTLPAESVTVHALDQVCGSVVRVANDIGTMIAAVFGGATPFAAGGQDATPVSGDSE